MWQIVGQSRVVSLLQATLKKGNLAHAYLLVGPTHVGKMTLALNLAQAVNCEADERPCGVCLSCQKISSGNHADVQVIAVSSPGKARVEIAIDQIREIQHNASLPPFEGKSKVFIIDGAECLSNEAANCLLKTLEEPPGRILFILLTSNARYIPATVISRCQRLDLYPLPVAELESALTTRWGADPAKARLLARLSKGCPGWAVAALSDGLLQQRAEKWQKFQEMMSAGGEERFSIAAQLADRFSQNRNAISEVLEQWQDWWRDIMLIKTGCHDIITSVDYESTINDWAKKFNLKEIWSAIAGIQAAEIQLGQNANPRLVFEVLMLNLPRKRERSN